MLTKLKNGLDGTQLKTIALVLMVLDHIHYFFEFTGCIPTVFSMLGRLSAPLFLFCTVEGFAHTHDRKRYFIRIWAIGTAMAALEFFMIYAKAFRRGDDFYPLNAIFQDLMLLCIVWQGIDWLREKKFAKGIAAIAAVLCWPFVMVAFLSAFPGGLYEVLCSPQALLLRPSEPGRWHDRLTNLPRGEQRIGERLE